MNAGSKKKGGAMCMYGVAVSVLGTFHMQPYVGRCIATARLAQSAERKALNLVVVGSSPTVGDFPSVAAAARPFVAQRAGNAKPPQRRKQTPACLHAPCVGGALSPLHVMLLVMLQQASSVSSSSKFGRGAIAMHVWHLPFMA